MAESPCRPRLLISTTTSEMERYYASRLPSSIDSRSSSLSTASEAISASTLSHPSSRTSLKSLKQQPEYADEHYPLITTTNPLFAPASKRSHPALSVARQMAQIHNTSIRAINSSYNNSLSIRPSTQEAKDFLLYNQQIAIFLGHHHHIEDAYLFPEIERLLGKPGAMEENKAGHEKFMEAFHVFEKYVFRTTAAEYNGLTLRHIIESFAPDLIKHLHEEIPTLVNLHVLNAKDLVEVWKEAEHRATKNIDLNSGAPWILGCQDREFEIDGEKCTFPDMPWVASSLVRHWHARKHKGAWRYCPSDLDGIRRELAAA